MVKKVITVGDLHSGRFDNSEEFLNDNIEFFDKFLFPIMAKYIPEEVIVVLLGDLFDNKQKIGTYTQSVILDKIEELSKKCNKLIIETGNHDTPFLDEIQHSAIKPLRLIPNVTIVGKDPFILEEEGCPTLGFTSWCNSSEKLKKNLEALREGGADYGFGHNSVYGFEHEGKSIEKKGHLSISDFAGFKTFFMGHIHKRQHIQNVRFTGSGLHCRAVEYKNLQVGIDVLDLATGEIEFIENNISPKFKRLNFLKLMDCPKNEFEKLISNNFVTLVIPSYLESVIDTSDFPKLFSSYRYLQVKTKIQERLEISDKQEESDDETAISINVSEFYERYMSTLDSVIVNKQQVRLTDEDKKKTLEKLFSYQKKAEELSKELELN